MYRIEIHNKHDAQPPFFCLFVSALPVLAAIFQVQDITLKLQDPRTLYDNIKALRIPTGHDISKLKFLISLWELEYKMVNARWHFDRSLFKVMYDNLVYHKYDA